MAYRGRNHTSSLYTLAGKNIGSLILCYTMYDLSFTMYASQIMRDANFDRLPAIRHIL